MNALRVLVAVALDLKRKLRREAKRAGMSLSSWVRGSSREQVLQIIRAAQDGIFG